MSNLVELCFKSGHQPTKEEYARIMFPIKQLIGVVTGVTMGVLQMGGIFTFFL